MIVEWIRVENVKLFVLYDSIEIISLGKYSVDFVVGDDDGETISSVLEAII